jgi:hypothetical protein
VTTRSNSPAPPEPQPEAGGESEPGYTPDPSEVSADQPAATLTAEEELDKEVADSFPASDPPSSWAGKSNSDE